MTHRLYRNANLAGLWETAVRWGVLETNADPAQQTAGSHRSSAQEVASAELGQREPSVVPDPPVTPCSAAPQPVLGLPNAASYRFPNVSAQRYQMLFVLWHVGSDAEFLRRCREAKWWL